MVHRIAATDLTYLLEECPRCFVLKVKHRIPRPSIALPSIFSRIGTLQEQYLCGKSTKIISDFIPDGRFIFREKHVKSKPSSFSGLRDSYSLSGRIDLVAALHDESFAVVDLKTAKPNETISEIYSRQLESYAYALENPEREGQGLSPVSILGLLYFYPVTSIEMGSGRLGLGGTLQWTNMKRDASRFLHRFEEVAAMIEGPMPEPNPKCPWCLYLEKMKGARQDDTEDVAKK